MTCSPPLDAARRPQGRAAPASSADGKRGVWLDIDGLSPEQAAAEMRERPSTVPALVVQERDRLELRKFKLDSIPTARVRAFLEQEMARDPHDLDGC